MIYREHYISQVREFYDSDLIKIITGIRRSGKSIILEQIKNEISKKTENVISLNFEDKRISSNILDAKSLIEYVESNRKKGKCYIFLDEIQTLDGWQEACKTLRLDNNSVFITGSNSKLLSGELSTLLAGRYVSFNIAPFTFQEVVELKGLTDKNDIEQAFNDYLLWGGMPQRFELDTVDKVKIYLSDVFDTIIFKDMIERNKITNATIFKRIVEYLVTNPSQAFSPTNMLKEFTKKNISVSTKTIYECLDYIESALLMTKASTFDIRGKRILSRKDKYYLTDLGIGQILNSNKKLQMGAYLENVVFNELLYRGYEVSIGNNNGREIDFVATRFKEKIYIQVCYILIDENVVNREFGAYDEIADNYPKYVLSMDKFDFSENGIIHKNIIDWLLEDK